MERHLVGSVSLRVEGGPIAQVFEQITTQGGAPAGTELATPVTWSVAGGVVARF